MDDTTRQVDELLASRTDWERQRSPNTRFTLDTMRALLACGVAERPVGAQLVQVAGSKGKGTVAGWLESWARLAGQRVGVYSSPHVSTIRERVRIDGEPVDGALLLTALRRVIERADAAGLRPSAFELLTAAALRCFAEQEPALDLVVLEVGLGGRLDATTAIDPVDALVVTSIELEHTEMLGDTIEAIAREKAAVVRRPARLAVTTATHPDAERVLAQVAAAAGVPLVAVDPASDLLRRADGRQEPVVLPEGLVEHQRVAARAAWTVWSALFPAEADRLARPLSPAAPRLPGRFEVLEVFETSTGSGGSEGRGDRRVAWVLDGAHTEASFAALAAACAKRWPHGRFGLLFGCALGKRWRQGLSVLRPLVDDLVVSPVAGTRCERPETIAAEAERLGFPSVEVVSDAAAGVERLRARGCEVRVVCGSFYLVGEVRDLLVTDDDTKR